MILMDLKDDLVKLLCQSLLDDISFVKKSLFNEEVFAYTIYCDAAFSRFGSAACTQQQVKKQLQFLVEEAGFESEAAAQLYAQTFAAEWNYYNDYRQGFFYAFNTLNAEIYTASTGGGIQGIMVAGDFDYEDYRLFYKFYINIIIDVINKLKAAHVLQDKPFCNDVLLGLQFGSADCIERDWMIEISGQVNSKIWHDKLVASLSIN